MTDEKEILELLFEIQKFDPAGVGARDLKECLLLQLDRIEQKNVYIIRLRYISYGQIEWLINSKVSKQWLMILTILTPKAVHYVFLIFKENLYGKNLRLSHYLIQS